MAATEIHKDELLRLLEAVLPHVGTDPELPKINALNVELGENHLTLAATDRFTLGVATSAAEVTGAPASVLVPLEAITHVLPIVRAERVAVVLTITTHSEVNTLALTCVGSGITLEMRGRPEDFVDYKTLLRKTTTNRGALATFKFTPRLLARLESITESVHVWVGATEEDMVLLTAGDWFAMLLAPRKRDESDDRELADVLASITSAETEPAAA